MKTNGTRIFLMRSILFVIILIYFSFVVFSQRDHRSFSGLDSKSIVSNTTTACFTTLTSYDKVVDRMMGNGSTDQKAPLNAQPVQAFRGEAIKEGARLEWLMNDEKDITSVSLERMYDARFVTIAEYWLNLEDKGQQIKKDFAFIDKATKKGENTYRLTIYKKSGEILQSDVIVIRKK